MRDYIPPTHKAAAYHCAHCGSFAHQTWSGTGYDGLFIAVCNRCNKYSIWVKEVMVYPDHSAAPLPNPDMPEDALQDYEEAASVINRSPRAAAALLRLAMEKICNSLEPDGKALNSKIGTMVQKGLRVEIQQSLDTVRVIGNNAVHPGQMDLKDDVSTCTRLFGLLNIIVEDQISQPKQIAELFDELPDNAKEAIDRRDGS